MLRTLEWLLRVRRLLRFHLFLTCTYNMLRDLVLLIKLSFLDTRESVEGQIAVVTGGAKGIGRHLCLELANLAVTVVIWDVDKKGALTTQKMIKEKGRQAYVYMCDVSDKQEVYRVAEMVKREVGKVDILVNNAGVANGKVLLELQDSDIEKTYGINILSHYWTCKAFLPDMIKDNRGHVLATSSLAGIIGVSKLSDYSGTKYAVLGFMESIQIELLEQGATGVKITTACPAFVKTDIFKSDHLKEIPHIEAKYAALAILDGMLKEKEVLFLPAYMSILRVFKATFLSVRTIVGFLMDEKVSKISGSMQAKGLSDVLAYKIE